MLAVGINYEDQGFATAKLTDDQNDPKEIAEFLELEIGVEFDTILVIKNDETIFQYHRGQNY